MSTGVGREWELILSSGRAKRRMLASVGRARELAPMPWTGAGVEK